MLSLLFVVLYFAFTAVAQSESVVCVAGQCLQGTSNVTIGAKLSASGSSTIQLLPGQYTSTTNPQLLHNLLTSSSATLSTSPGFDNASLSSLPLNLVLQPGLAIYQGSGYSGQAAFSPLPSVPLGNNSVPIPANSLSIATNVWAAVSIGGSSGSRVVLWESVPDVAQLPSGSTRALSLLDMQSASCSPACSGSGICGANGTCICPPGFTGSACETCATGFFGPKCEACPSGCKTCDEGIAGSGRCLTPIVPNAPSTCNCINGQCGSDGQCTCLQGWTTSTNGTQCAQCAPGFFLSTTGTCQVCQLGCSECADSTAQCTSCKSGFIIDATDKTTCNAAAQVATGGGPCPSGSFSANGVCTPCSSTCQTCAGPSSSDCVICASGQYGFNGNCVGTNTDGVCTGTNGLIADNIKRECDVCGAACTSCKYPNFSGASIISQLQCTGCLPGFVLSLGKCLPQCPTGNFVSPQDNLTCVACSSSCSSCVGSSDFCLSCPAGQFASSGKCVTTCPSNTFTSDGECVKCHPDCATCSGPSFNQCSTCPPGLPVLTGGRCLPTCTKSQFYDTTSGACKACDTSCSSCAGDGPSNCLACASSTSVLRSGSCVQANCAGASNVIAGLGLCLSDLVATKPGATPAPTISGLGDPTTITKRRGLQWWEILLMALGCAFIFLVVIWLFRRRAKKQRAKRTAQFASKKNLDVQQGWRWRLKRFFGGGKRTTKLQRHPSDDVLPVNYASYKAYTRSRPTSAAYSVVEDIKMKPMNAKSDTKAKVKARRSMEDDDDIDMFIDSYNHSAYTRESRAPSTLPGLEERRHLQRANQRHLERDSIYSQVTGVQRHTPEPRQPVRRAPSSASRLTSHTEIARHYTGSREGVLVDVDDDDKPPSIPPLPLQMLGTGGSAAYLAQQQHQQPPPTEAQLYAQKYAATPRPEQPVLGTIGSSATGASFMPIPVTLTGVGGTGQGQYWLTPVPPQNTAASQQQQQQQQFPIPTYLTPGGQSQDTVVIQPMNTGGSFSRNPFRQF